MELVSPTDEEIAVTIMPADIATKDRKPKKKVVPTLRIFHGTFVHSTREEPVVILKKWMVGVDNGKIVFSEPVINLADVAEKYKLKDVLKEVTIPLAEGRFMIPGFVDVHADTVPLLGQGIQDPQRLREKKQFVHDDKIARKLFNNIIEHSTGCGTTTAAYDGTHIESAVRMLSNTCVQKKQRAFVGFDVALPEKSEELHMIQIMKTVDVMNHIKRQQGRVTPHLIMSSQLMPYQTERVLDIQKQMDVTLKVVTWQTADVDATGDVDDESADVPNGDHNGDHHGDQNGDHHGDHNCRTDTSAAKNDIISNRTIVLQTSSRIHTPAELSRLKKAEAGLAYCPGDNLRHLKLTDVRALLASGVKLGLGSADSGSMSILGVIRQCMQVATHASKSSEHCPGETSGPDEPTVVTYKELFRLATLGGAEVLGLDRRVGNFDVGKEFDAILVDPHVPSCQFFLLPDKDTPEDILERFLFCGDDRNMTAVYVGGQRAK